MSKLERGTVVRWFDDRGFGFIKPDGGAPEDVFVHIKTLRHCGIDVAEVGMMVRFERGAGRGGKPEAINVELA